MLSELVSAWYLQLTDVLTLTMAQVISFRATSPTSLPSRMAIFAGEIASEMGAEARRSLLPGAARAAIGRTRESIVETSILILTKTRIKFASTRSLKLLKGCITVMRRF
jgi:hypothetical protein